MLLQNTGNIPLLRRKSNKKLIFREGIDEFCDYLGEERRVRSRAREEKG